MRFEEFLRISCTLVLFAGHPFQTAPAPAAIATEERELVKGGGFEDGANAFWEQESKAGSILIQQASPALAHAGLGVARLGGAPKTTDILDQPLGAFAEFASSGTLSFFWKVAGEKLRWSANDVLYAELVDSNTGQAVQLASFRASEGSEYWSFATVPFTPEGLGLSAKTDYFLRFEADIRSVSGPPTFDIDDVSLAYSGIALSAPALLLPVDPPDPDLPPPVLDEDGDLQYESTSGYGLDMSVHRDPPNSCPCNGSHQTIVLTATGFATLDQNAKVKFGTQGFATMKQVTNFTVTSLGGGAFQVTCTIPDSPYKNVLGGGVIKVKENGHVAQSKPHAVHEGDCSEIGFMWGFPDRISNIAVQSTATPTIIGGDSFAVTASGLHAFQHWRSNTTPPACGTRQAPSQNIDFDYPLIYAQNGATPPVKIRVKGDGTFDCGSSLYAGATWSGDGAPTVCPQNPGPNVPPCINTSQARDLVILNPDNISGTPDYYGYPQPKTACYQGKLNSAITFTPPPSNKQPAFSPGQGYGPTNSVGLGANGDIAIRPLNNATNHVTFQGVNLYRITSMIGDDGQPISLPFDGGPTRAQAGWGTSFAGWVGSHAPGTDTPYFATKDDPSPGVPTHRLQVAHAVVPSFAGASGSSSCLQTGSGTPCVGPIVVPDYGGSQDIEYLLVGPGEAASVRPSIVGCQANVGGPSCGAFSLIPTVVSVGAPDSYNRQVVKLHIQYSSTAPLYSGSVTYTLQLTSGYGVVETWNITLVR